MKNRSTAERRHQLKKREKKYKKIVKECWTVEDKETIEIYGKHLAQVGKTCSCAMCGNPRKYGEKPIQEKKADIKAKQDLEEATYL